MLENFRPGTLERWGLGYEDLQKVNAGLIMVRVSGYGQSGPYSERAGYGSIGEAMGGLRYVVGSPDAPPSRVGISIGDSLAGLFATVGALSALHYRDRTGRGQVIDAAIYEAVLGVMESLVPEYQAGGYVRERTGSILPGVAPSNAYPTRDGAMILIAANQDTVFQRLAEAMQQPELAADARYRDHHARGERQAELDERIAAWTARHDVDEIAELMERHGVPAGKIYRAADMLRDPHFQARESIIRRLHPEYGELAMQNVFPKLSLTPGEVRSCGPELGEHNGEILGGLLGLDRARLRQLEADGII